MPKLTEITDEIILDIYEAATEVLYGGVYIPSKEHECGWDFLNFNIRDLNKNNINCFKFEYLDFNKSYSDHHFDNCTLKEILKETDGVYALQKHEIDWI